MPALTIAMLMSFLHTFTQSKLLPGSMMSTSNSDEFFNSFMRPRKKRGRKSKAEKEAETKAATEAAIVASYQRIVSLDLDSDVRVPMINLEVCSYRLLIDLVHLVANLALIFFFYVSGW